MQHLLPYLILWAATFAQVFVRVLQQINVIHHDYWMMPIGSYGLAYTELLIVIYGGIGIATKGRSWVVTGFVIGTGGWMGACISMFVFG